MEAKRKYMPESLVEQIFAVMLANLEGRVEFDAQTIQGIKQLVVNGDLKKAAEVAKALKLTPGETL